MHDRLVITKGIKGNCLQNLKRAIDTGALQPPVPGSYSDLDFRHDGRCKIYTGKRICNCDPDILLNGKIVWPPNECAKESA